ncbi:MAG: cupin domain-containing protein [Rhodospirillaceae bacterium]
MATATREIVPPAIGSDEIRRRQLALAENAKPAVFNVAGQLLARGRTDTPLAATEDMSIRLKIYAEGGENELHAHPGEDHSFIVLQGRVRFYDPDGGETVLGADQGIMLPKGTLYRFTAIEGEPLVMLRIGTPNFRKLPEPDRIDADGNPMRGDSKENRSVPAEFLEGRFYGRV